MGIKNFIRFYTRKLPSPLRNKFLVTAIIFFVWLLLFDRNNILDQWELSNVEKDITQKKEQYEKDIIVVKREAEAMKNPDELERIAREKYLMKKENEDIFVIVEDN